jgi:hypothetical protein
MQSVHCAHIPIAAKRIRQEKAAPKATEPQESLLQNELDSDWEQASQELAKALSRPVRKRNRERFGMALDLREALTRFARISSKEAFDAFQRAFPTFFPATFWNSSHYAHDIPGSRPIRFWRVWQRLLLDAWRAEFHPDYVSQLLKSLGESSLEELPEFGKLRLVEIQSVHNCERAVIAMGKSPWRAKFCSKCGQPFVADKPQRDYCSDECRSRVHQLAWRERWEKYGRKWRQRRRTSKTKRRRV